jgi:ferredoxin
MPKINFVREDIQVEVAEGDHVRYPALENDVKIYTGLWKFANCHGNGMCATDRVVVTPSANVNPPTVLEKFRLGSALTKNPNLRLACQVQVYGDVEVETLYKD